MNEKVDFERISFSPETIILIEHMRKSLREYSMIIKKDQEPEIIIEKENNNSLVIIIKIATLSGELMAKIDVPMRYWGYVQ